MLCTKLETFCCKPGLCGDLKLPGLNGLVVIWLGTIPWGSNMLQQDCILELMLTTNSCWFQGKMPLWPILVFTFGKFLFYLIYPLDLLKLNTKTQNIFCCLNENLTAFFYTLTGGTIKQKEKKKISFKVYTKVERYWKNLGFSI